MIEGEWCKFNSNSGWVKDMEALAEALSHFSYDYSEGQCLLCDELLLGRSGRSGRNPGRLSGPPQMHPRLFLGLLRQDQTPSPPPPPPTAGAPGRLSGRPKCK